MRELIRDRADRAEAVFGLADLLLNSHKLGQGDNVLNCISMIRRELDKLQATQIEIKRRDREARNIRRINL